MKGLKRSIKMERRFFMIVMIFADKQPYHNKFIKIIKNPRSIFLTCGYIL